jgi:hypothetical protein
MPTPVDIDRLALLEPAGADTAKIKIPLFIVLICGPFLV